MCDLDGHAASERRLCEVELRPRLAAERALRWRADEAAMV